MKHLKKQKGGISSDEEKLLEAARKQDIDTVVNLLKKGVNINVEEDDDYPDTALTIASAFANTELATLLLDNGADINHQNKYGNTALMEALDYGAAGEEEEKVEIVSLLIKRGADVHIQDPYGKTVLDRAKRYKYLEVVKIIQESIEQEASRQIKDIANQIQKAAKYIEKTAEQIGPQHKVPKGLKENLGGRRKTRKSKKSNKKTRKHNKKYKNKH